MPYYLQLQNVTVEMLSWKCSRVVLENSSQKPSNVLEFDVLPLVWTLVGSHTVIICGLGLRVRVNFGIMVRVSKLLGSNYNPNLNPNFTLTIIITINLP